MALPHAATIEFRFTDASGSRTARGHAPPHRAHHEIISEGAGNARAQRHLAPAPGGIFSRAFVRSYAAEIGADRDEAVHDFLSQLPHESTTNDPHAASDDRSRGRRFVARAMMVVATLAVVAGVILFLSLK